MHTIEFFMEAVDGGDEGIKSTFIWNYLSSIQFPCMQFIMVAHIVHLFDSDSNLRRNELIRMCKIVLN